MRLTQRAGHREGRTYMRLKRPSISGGDAKENAGGRAGVDDFLHPEAKRPRMHPNTVSLCGKPV